MPSSRVESFIREVRAKLNQNLFWSILVWSCSVGAITLFAVGLAFVAQGFAVPKLLYPVAILSAFAASVGVWWIRRVSQAEACNYADEHFGFKDSVTSLNAASDRPFRTR